MGEDVHPAELLEVLGRVGKEPGGEDGEDRPEDCEEAADVDPPAEPVDREGDGEGGDEPEHPSKDEVVRIAAGGKDDGEREDGRLEALPSDGLKGEKPEPEPLPTLERPLGPLPELL